MRTLTIGDRTISYDTGLNYGLNYTTPSLPDMSRSQISDDSTTDDRTSSEHAYSTGGTSEYSCGTASVCSDDHEDVGSGSGHPTPCLGRDSSRKLIKPDLMAMSQLLNFDEEDEDDIESEEEPEKGDDKSSSPSDWQKTVVKDLANQTKKRVQRRHSITLCTNSYRRKSSVSSCSSTQSGSSNQSTPKTSFSSTNSNYAESTSPSSPSPSYKLNTSQMHASLQEEYNSPEWQRALQTLNLSLDEVAHIRSVLTKAELEGLPLEGSVKENVCKGKVCFLCMKTRFGIFNRGQKCEMCKQIVCSKCHTKMNIPVEHFTATPVYALSPQQDGKQAMNHANNGQRTPVFKLGVPKLPGATNSAGSAPNSPDLRRKFSQDSHNLNLVRRTEDLSLDNSFLNSPAPQGITTISGLTSLPPASPEPGSFQPISLPYNSSKYNTLPKKTNRRWSMISSRSSVEREKLEGSPLNVCLDCKEMVLQVIRTSRTTKKMQLARSMFFNNLTPNVYKHHRL
jgi:spire-like protein